MLVEERYNQLIAMLGGEKFVTVRDMANKLFVSEATIRRDLTAIEKTGIIRRVHGGAILVKQSNKDVSLYLRENVNAEAKNIIARKAMNIVKKDHVIILDASSTAYTLIPYLSPKDNLVIVTNGIKVAYELGKKHIKTLCTGGIMIDNSFSFIGHHAESLIESIQADLMFFSTRGISTAGIMSDTSIEETKLRQVMLKHSKRKILLCDSSKFGKEYFFTLGSLTEIDEMISETTLPESWQRMIKD